MVDGQFSTHTHKHTLSPQSSPDKLLFPPALGISFSTQGMGEDMTAGSESVLDITPSSGPLRNMS